MAEVYLGQIMLTGFAFSPRGFAQCNGQLLGVAQNQALFSLLGVKYGGNGIQNFGLPNLQGRAPVGYGASAAAGGPSEPYPIGTPGGTEAVTLTEATLPQHMHMGLGSTVAATLRNPAGAVYGTTSNPIYAAASGPQVTLEPQTVARAGGGGAHDNMQPYLVINYNIALAGVFPSRQ